MCPCLLPTVITNDSVFPLLSQALLYVYLVPSEQKGGKNQCWRQTQVMQMPCWVTERKRSCGDRVIGPAARTGATDRSAAAARNCLRALGGTRLGGGGGQTTSSSSFPTSLLFLRFASEGHSFRLLACKGMRQSASTHYPSLSNLFVLESTMQQGTADERKVHCKL